MICKCIRGMMRLHSFTFRKVLFCFKELSDFLNSPSTTFFLSNLPIYSNSSFKAMPLWDEHCWHIRAYLQQKERNYLNWKALKIVSVQSKDVRDHITKMYHIRILNRGYWSDKSSLAFTTQTCKHIHPDDLLELNRKTAHQGRTYLQCWAVTSYM